jgi:hypothetical protein
MTRVMLLTQADCVYCEHAKQVLARVAAEHPLAVEEIRTPRDATSPSGTACCSPPASWSTASRSATAGCRRRSYAGS